MMEIKSQVVFSLLFTSVATTRGQRIVRVVVVAVLVIFLIFSSADKHMHNVVIFRPFVIVTLRVERFLPDGFL